MSGILAEIIERKKSEVERCKAERPPDIVKSIALETDPARDFYAALRKEGVRIIAECKKKSPSKGILMEDYDPVALARSYEKGGAAAVSVLTDEPYFGGSREHLRRVRESVSLPVLRKDFIIDDYQIWEARSLGADSFLLLSGVLDYAALQYFIEVGRELGMEPLIESHTEAQLTEALKTDGKIFGINNRNLDNFSVSLEHGKSMLPKMQSDPDRVLVCESGVRRPDDIRDMHKAGYGAFLIGETLVRSGDPVRCLRDLRQ